MTDRQIEAEITAIRAKATDPDEACVGCEYAGGIVLHYCTHRQSEFYGQLVYWEGWCPQFVPRKG